MPPPGSFTKNFGWNRHPPGLSRLYDVIRAGFGGVAEPVTRDHFRAHCGLTDRDRQLIPVNFFLHNTISDGTNYVTVDELVRHAINNPHSRRFDQLALFSLHLSRMGLRRGVAGTALGASFTNEFVRDHLWRNGGWASARLTEQQVEAAFTKTIQGQQDSIHKCMTNYVYMTEMMGLRGAGTPIINTRVEEWIGPGLFVAFDRYSVDRTTPGPLDQDELHQMVTTDELYKLMGTTQSYLDSVYPFVADEYLRLGGLNRVTTAAILDDAGVPVVSSPTTSEDDTDTVPKWSDEDAEDAAIVQRRLQESLAQIRNPQNVRELKTLYGNTCVFCGRQIVVGINPAKHYSEAAHIRPVGQPHNGPDRKDNMIILCPEHHLQFDRGLLRIRRTPTGFEVRSKITGDPLHRSALLLRPPHTLSQEYVVWHYHFWSG